MHDFKLWTIDELTGGDAKCDVEELLQELPEPELGYEGIGTGAAGQRERHVNTYANQINQTPLH